MDHSATQGLMIGEARFERKMGGKPLAAEQKSLSMFNVGLQPKMTQCLAYL
jgi:hypothetical protein